MGSLYKRKRKDSKGRERVSPVWWIKYYRNGKDFRESSNSTRRSVAERLLREREGCIARGLPVNPKADKIKFDEICEDVVNDYIVNENRSLPDLKRRLTKHILAYFGGSTAAAITPAHIQRYIVHRRNQGAKNATINRELAIIRRAYSLGIQNERILRRPTFSLLKERNARSGFPDTSEIRSIVRNLPDYLKPLTWFTYWTGVRKNEALKLTWSAVDFEAGVVHLFAETTKTGEGRVFPMTTDLHELLETQRRETEILQRQLGRVIPWVFHHNGNRICNFYCAWRTACRKAGCPGRIFHDLRRSAVRNLVRAGVPERVAMQLTGHKTRTIFERYNIVSEGDLQLAVEKLNRAGGQR